MPTATCADAPAGDGGVERAIATARIQQQRTTRRPAASRRAHLSLGQRLVEIAEELDALGLDTRLPRGTLIARALIAAGADPDMVGPLAWRAAEALRVLGFGFEQVAAEAR